MKKTNSEQSAAATGVSPSGDPNRRVFLSTVGAGAVLLFTPNLAPGQASATRTETGPNDKVFRWATEGDIHSMEPYGVNETFTLGFLGNIYEGLVRRGKTLEIEPSLGVSWSNPAPDVWRFDLRKGVQFHDGSRFTADDVIFSWKRTLSNGSDLKTYVSGIKNIEKRNDYQIDITTAGPRPVFLGEISLWYIMSKSWAESNGASEVGQFSQGKETYANRHANGTGPFKLKTREPGVQTTLIANPNWWGTAGKESNLTAAVLTPIKEAATRLASFLSGTVDMIDPVSLQDVARVNSTQGLRVIQGPEARTIYLGMDVFRDELLYSNVKGRNPLKDVRVRKALYQAIDINAIKQKVMHGAARPTGLLIGPGINGFDEKLDKRFSYDPAEAKRLLADAGYAGGFQIVLDCFNDRFINDEAICTAIAAMWTQIGVKTRLNAQAKSKHVAKIQALDTSVYEIGWTPPTYDMYNTYFNNVMTRAERVKDYKPEPGQGQWNFGGYSNARLDELMRKIANEVIPQKRNTMISEVLAVHKEEVGHLPLHQQTLAWGVRDNVDVVQVPDGVLNLRWVKLK